MTGGAEAERRAGNVQLFKSSRCLGHGAWCFCLALARDSTGRGLRDCSWNSPDCQGPAAQPMGYVWIPQL